MGQYLEGSTITTYKYDYADRLVKRTTGNSTMEYYYDGDRLVAQSSSDGSRIYYFYDDAGVCGAEYNNEYYEFVRNIFGDIVVVLKGGEIAGRYEYDPFGVCTEDTQNNFVKLNPFRYCGYFYDTVSGMYLLKTRFYDPVTAQFLSPDHPDYLDPETLGGIDLYAYCLNNPVMYTDPYGTNVVDEISELIGWIGIVSKIGINFLFGLSITQNVSISAKQFAILLKGFGQRLSSTFSIASNILIGFSNLIDGINEGKSALNIMTDTVFDLTAVSLGVSIGASIGSIFPVGGAIIGGAIGGAFSYLYTRVEPVQIIQETKQGFFDGVNQLFNDFAKVGSLINKACLDAIMFLNSKISNFLKTLFGW